jgi:hypothetical protein
MQTAHSDMDIQFNMQELLSDYNKQMCCSFLHTPSLLVLELLLL